MTPERRFTDAELCEFIRNADRLDTFGLAKLDLEVRTVLALEAIAAALTPKEPGEC